jgi:multidrug efflux pump subunit AcrB
VRIERGYIDPPVMKVTATGIPALALAVSMREGGDIIELGRQVKELIFRLEQSYPIGVEFDIAAFQPDIVNDKINQFTGNLLQAILIVMGVMLVTLGLRTGLIVAALVPMTMITTLMIMSFFDIGLDQMSLAALIVSLGLLVDAAIVMSESILVQLEEGKSAVQAAIDSARELRIPLLTSSLTTVAAFLPIYLAESAVGEYTAPLFKVVTIALLCSWMLALTMMPLLCVLFLKLKKKKKAGYDSPFYQAYRKLLLMGLRHRTLTVLGAVLLFITVMWAARFVEQSFFPRKDLEMFTAEIELPYGVPFERTEAMMTELEQFMRDSLMVGIDRDDGLVNWAAFIGSGAPRFVLVYNPEQPRHNYVYMLINASSYGAQPELIERIEQFMYNRFPDTIVRLEQLQNGLPVEHPVEVRISGDDSNVIFNIIDQVKARLHEFSGIRNIGDDWGQRTKKLVVSIDGPRAQRAGLTNRDIAVSLQTALTGFTITQYREQDELIPVVLKSISADRNDLGKLESINVFAQVTGKNVPLRQVADVELAFQPSKILRRDRFRTVVAYADIVPNSGVTSFEVVAKLAPWLKEISASWPIGYKYEFGGEVETSGDSQESINVKLPIAGLIILLLLVGQFNSVRKPAIILLTIPLGLIGVVLGLLITGHAFGFMALLGVVSLSGIVINNAIVLIDRIQYEIEVNKREPSEAILESAQRRLRPILLTTATTVGGLVPLWLGGGPLFETMAVVILFGLLFATVLTLGFIPTLYAIFFRVRFKL